MRKTGEQRRVAGCLMALDGSSSRRRLFKRCSNHWRIACWHGIPRRCSVERHFEHWIHLHNVWKMSGYIHIYTHMESERYRQDCAIPFLRSCFLVSFIILSPTPFPHSPLSSPLWPLASRKQLPLRFPLSLFLFTGNRIRWPCSILWTCGNAIQAISEMRKAFCGWWQERPWYRVVSSCPKAHSILCTGYSSKHTTRGNYDNAESTLRRQHQQLSPRKSERQKWKQEKNKQDDK